MGIRRVAKDIDIARRKVELQRQCTSDMRIILGQRDEYSRAMNGVTIVHSDHPLTQSLEWGRKTGRAPGDLIAVGTLISERPPAQNRAGPIRALGSHFGCLTAKRSLGHGCRIRDLKPAEPPPIKRARRSEFERIGKSSLTGCSPTRQLSPLYPSVRLPSQRTAPARRAKMGAPHG